MHPDFAPKLADLVTDYSVPIEAGDFVVIQSTQQAIPLMESLYDAVIKRGGIPHTVVHLPYLTEHFLRTASPKQIEFVNPVQKAIYEVADVLINIDAPLHTSQLISVDPETMQMNSIANHGVMEVFFRRIGDSSLRWTLCAWPTQSRAQQADMSYYAYQDFVYRAYGLHLDNPAAYWRDMEQRQARYVEWLTGKSRIEVTGPGIDMAFEMTGRNWYSAHGNANFPDGEILTCPLETTVNGFVEFSYPAYYNGNRVDGVRLEFNDGVVVKASARHNEAFLLSTLDIDENARRLGEFAIGTNDFIQNVTGSTLFDEKIGGTIHMALGQSAAPSEGKNPSKIHWDIVHNMREGGEIKVDGTLFYKSGKFMVDG